MPMVRGRLVIGQPAHLSVAGDMERQTKGGADLRQVFALNRDLQVSVRPRLLSSQRSRAQPPATHHGAVTPARRVATSCGLQAAQASSGGPSQCLVMVKA